jgi:hypothetical protein
MYYRYLFIDAVPKRELRSANQRGGLVLEQFPLVWNSVNALLTSVILVQYKEDIAI